jgi:hypothetical protein
MVLYQTFTGLPARKTATLAAHRANRRMIFTFDSVPILPGLLYPSVYYTPFTGIIRTSIAFVPVGPVLNSAPHCSSRG